MDLMDLTGFIIGSHHYKRRGSVLATGEEKLFMEKAVGLGPPGGVRAPNRSSCHPRAIRGW
jgi:hypothetical protein